MTTVATEKQNGNDTLALVMKGGGVKGLAYVGAIEILEQKYEFDWYVGTSAGAITAILLAAGYTVQELKELLLAKNFNDFFDANWYQQIFNLFAYHGKHPARAFTNWLDQLLAKKLNSFARVKLSDLPKRVTLYASRKGKRVLTFDSRGENKDSEAAYAARCSMSIPYYFIPQSDQGFFTYDGGLLFNYPVNEILHANPNQNFIGLYLGNETYQPDVKSSVIWDILSIYTENADAELVQKYRDRTVIINPRPVETLDFDLDLNDKELLLKSGMLGALKHLKGKDNDEVKAFENEVSSLRKTSEDIRTVKLAYKKKKWFLILFCFLATCIATFFYVKNRLNEAASEVDARMNNPVPFELLPDPTKEASYPSPAAINSSRERSIQNTVLNYENLSERDARMVLFDCELHAKQQPVTDTYERSSFTEDWPFRSHTKDFSSSFRIKSNWYGIYVFDVSDQTLDLIGFFDLTTKKSWHIQIIYNDKHFVLKGNP